MHTTPAPIARRSSAAVLAAFAAAAAVVGAVVVALILSFTGHLDHATSNPATSSTPAHTTSAPTRYTPAPVTSSPAVAKLQQELGQLNYYERRETFSLRSAHPGTVAELELPDSDGDLRARARSAAHQSVERRP